jgi:hypothetical protein
LHPLGRCDCRTHQNDNDREPYRRPSNAPNCGKVFVLVSFAHVAVPTPHTHSHRRNRIQGSRTSQRSLTTKEESLPRPSDEEASSSQLPYSPSPEFCCMVHREFGIVNGRSEIGCLDLEGFVAPAPAPARGFFSMLTASKSSTLSRMGSLSRVSLPA